MIPSKSDCVEYGEMTIPKSDVSKNLTCEKAIENQVIISRVVSQSEKPN